MTALSRVLNTLKTHDNLLLALDTMDTINMWFDNLFTPE